MHNVSQIRTQLSVRHAFGKTMMTRHILIPVRIFFILVRQTVPSRESLTHVLKFLARTLLLLCFNGGGWDAVFICCFPIFLCLGLNSHGLLCEECEFSLFKLGIFHGSSPHFDFFLSRSHGPKYERNKNIK